MAPLLQRLSNVERAALRDAALRYERKRRVLKVLALLLGVAGIIMGGLVLSYGELDEPTLLTVALVTGGSWGVGLMVLLDRRTPHVMWLLKRANVSNAERLFIANAIARDANARLAIIRNDSMDL